MKCSEITYKKVSELVLLPENPRTITKNDFERLVDSIKINGFWKHRPLAVMERDGKLVVLAGNQRLKAARKLKLADGQLFVHLRHLRIVSFLCLAIFGRCLRASAAAGRGLRRSPAGRWHLVRWGCWPR